MEGVRAAVSATIDTVSVATVVAIAIDAAAAVPSVSVMFDPVGNDTRYFTGN